MYVCMCDVFSTADLPFSDGDIIIIVHEMLIKTISVKRSV